MPMKQPNTLLQRSRTAIPGGVNSPVRAFRAVQAEPLFARSAHGALLTATDGREYIDYCMSFGPLILGHAHPDVVQAVIHAAQRGTSYAMTTEAEIELAERIIHAIPSVERVRLVNSGTEACMTAVRLARGVTGRAKILKFSGCYHGHSDGMLVKAGSGVGGIASASSAGIPQACVADTLVARYNHPDDVERIIGEYGSDLAAILVEPVAANMGLVMPADGFLAFLRNQANACGALLIFDGVISGFRFCFGEYQNLCGVMPDLTCLGKIIGGGMPMGAVGGRASIMDQLAPLGAVYQAGTLSGNPVSVAAGLATLKRLQSDQPYEQLTQQTRKLTDAIRDIARSLDIALQVPTFGSLFAVVFTDRTIRGFEDIEQTRQDLFEQLFHALLKQAVYLPPSPFEVCFLSTAHEDHHLQQTITAWATALEYVAQNDGKRA